MSNNNCFAFLYVAITSTYLPTGRYKITLEMNNARETKKPSKTPTSCPTFHAICQMLPCHCVASLYQFKSFQFFNLHNSVPNNASCKRPSLCKMVARALRTRKSHNRHLFFPFQNAKQTLIHMLPKSHSVRFAPFSSSVMISPCLFFSSSPPILGRRLHHRAR